MSSKARAMSLLSLSGDSLGFFPKTSSAWAISRSRKRSSRLKERKYKVSFAESCTGGLLAAKIVSVPGASSILGESFVVYSNEAKMKYLGVKSETLAAHGAVSEETVREMVDGLERIGAGDALVSASGIAGPEGGSREKPVGLVYCAVKIGGVTWSESAFLKRPQSNPRKGGLLGFGKTVDLP